MIGLSIFLDGDGAFIDLKDKPVTKGEFTRVAMLEKGMASGMPSVAMIIETQDGKTVFAETSMKLFLAAAAAFKAKCDMLGIEGL